MDKARDYRCATETLYKDGSKVVVNKEDASKWKSQGWDPNAPIAKAPKESKETKGK